MFLRYAIDKGWFDVIILHLSCGNEENKAAMAQYLSKYLFEKYEDEEMFAASQCEMPVSTCMKPESVATMVDDANINLTSWEYYIII